MRIQRVPASRLDQPERRARRRSRASNARVTAARGPRDRRSRNEWVVRALLAAYERRQPEEVRQLFSPAARIHVEPPSEAAGDYLGLDGAVEWLRRVEADLGPGVRMSVHDLLASATHVVVLYDLHPARGTRPLRRVGVYHVSRDRIRDLTITAGPSND